MILCGTNVLRRSDQSFLGERFIDFEMRISHADEEDVSNKVLERSMAQALDPSNLPPETPVQAAAKGFIDHLMQRPMNTRLSLETQKEILKLARLTAKMRTKVDRDTFGKGDITFSPVSELPTRLIGQLTKMCMCVPIITGHSEEHKYTIPLLRKVIKDIVNPSSNRYKLCLDLMEGWYGRNELMESTGLSKSVTNRELDDLRALDLVDMKAAPSHLPKHARTVFTLKEEIKDGLLLVGLQ